MRILAGFVAALVALAVIGFGIVATGAYDVGADDAHFDPVYWALKTTLHRSVERRADDIDAPELTDAMAREGYSAYAAACVNCHGAPGLERARWAEGMKPNPPQLSEAATGWEPQEIFWILKHGIKMSGMPDFSERHSDEMLWNVVALVERLPDLGPDELLELITPPSGEQQTSGQASAEPEATGTTDGGDGASDSESSSGGG